MNGSCCVTVCNDEKVNFYNRHKETFGKFVFSKQEMRANFKEPGLAIFCGEYLNKSQADEQSKETNGRLVLFDVIWYNNKSLVGTKAIERQELLRKIFPTQRYNDWIDRVSENLFMVKNFDKDFLNLYNDMTKHAVYEGLVLKRRDGVLRPGSTEKNNMDWQIKCRKETKNYTF